MFIGCLMAATSSPNLVSLIQNPEEKKAGRRSSDPHPPHHFRSRPESHPQFCSRLWPPPPLCPISSRSHRSSTASLTAPSLCVTLQVPQAFPEDLLASAREAGDHLHSLSSPPIQPHPNLIPSSVSGSPLPLPPLTGY